MKSLEELMTLKAKMQDQTKVDGTDCEYRILVGMATCGIAAGARPVLNAFVDGIADAGLSDRTVVMQTGCIGICQFEPVVEIYGKDNTRTTYVKMNAEKAKEVVERHIKGGEVVKEYTIGAGRADSGEIVTSLPDTDFFKRQKRVALRNCGIIDPESIDDYIAKDGYFALAKCLKELTPKEVTQTILESGLRGRGGGGFPTGKKWSFVADGPKKYVVCNADEGDPGAFMDRSVLEGDPHCILEAMAIAGYATGSDEGWIYVRAEYPIAVKRLNIAIRQAREYGLLGEHIFGTDFNFDIHIRLGAGAFVCGEETALMTSIEGNRGEPRPRPPFPAVKGLFGCPTVENNVETFANVPQIILNGAQWFASMGTEKSKGTKVFALG
ncbi:MAG: NADH-quinone oxidoreductase subunit F, partial [Clostridia bacterium]|nr:NADH-quinone oxidoreductase subunit F [Clostridia bacterium]